MVSINVTLVVACALVDAAPHSINFTVARLPPRRRRIAKQKRPRSQRGLFSSGLGGAGFSKRAAGLFEKSLAGGAQIVGRRLARAAIRHDLVGDLLAFTQRSKPGTLDGADMHEHIVAAVIRLDEAVTLGCVKPLHGSHAHGIVPSQISDVETHFWRAGEIEFLEGSSAPEPAVPVDS